MAAAGAAARSSKNKSRLLSYGRSPTCGSACRASLYAYVWPCLKCSRKENCQEAGEVILPLPMALMGCWPDGVHSIAKADESLTRAFLWLYVADTEMQ